MKITVVNGSPRKGGNTEIMVAAFVKGALEAGHQIEVKNLAGKNIHGCIGCGYCATHMGRCIQKDDVVEIIDSINQADMVVFASPIYWNYVTGQLKCVIDRLHSYGDKGFPFTKSALLLNAAVEETFDLSIQWYLQACEYQNWENKGIVAIGGMNKIGAMRESEKLKSVYYFGKNFKQA